REAVVHIDAALAALARLPETPERLAHAIDLRPALRSALFPRGQIARALDNLKEAEACALRLGDRRRLAWTLAYMIRDFSILRMPAPAMEPGGEALAP